MIYCYLKGGLGNIMFQISATIAIAETNSQEYAFINLDEHIGSLERQYGRNIDVGSYNSFFKNVKNRNVYPPDHTRIERFPFNYVSKPVRDCVIDGYFQSEKYFSSHRKQIRKLFNFEHVSDKMIDKYGIVKANNNISLHIRRGDYLSLTDYHRVLNLDYYYEAIGRIGPHDKIYVFSDDLDWCCDKFSDYDCIFVEESDIESLFLMTTSKNNIIANSSFSWWGAWLNTNPDKRVIAPKTWFGVKNSHIATADIYCNNWEII